MSKELLLTHAHGLELTNSFTSSRSSEARVSEVARGDRRRRSTWVEHSDAATDEVLVNQYGAKDTSIGSDQDHARSGPTAWGGHSVEVVEFEEYVLDLARSKLKAVDKDNVQLIGGQCSWEIFEFNTEEGRLKVDKGNSL